MMELFSERTLEFVISVRDTMIEDFQDQVFSDFEDNPWGIGHFGGCTVAEPGTDICSRLSINAMFRREALDKAPALLQYMKDRGYDCHYKE